MQKISLNKDDDYCFTSYYRYGTIKTRNSGMFSVTDEAREKINAYIIEIVNNEKNRK